MMTEFTFLDEVFLKPHFPSSSYFLFSIIIQVPCSQLNVINSILHSVTRRTQSCMREGERGNKVEGK